MFHLLSARKLLNEVRPFLERELDLLQRHYPNEWNRLPVFIEMGKAGRLCVNSYVKSFGSSDYGSMCFYGALFEDEDDACRASILIDSLFEDNGIHHFPFVSLEKALKSMQTHTPIELWLCYCYEYEVSLGGKTDILGADNPYLRLFLAFLEERLFGAKLQSKTL